MDSLIAKQLVDKIYEKRKAAALDLERQVRDCHQQRDDRRIGQIVDQLIEMFSETSNPLHVRNGGLIGLAGTAIALGVDVAPHMDKFIHPLLRCFVDTENRIRYFSAECLYNIAKVSKGEVLVYFNDIFDALSKLAADSELSVKNGAELLDRLLKDIVAESASVYIPLYPETEKARMERDQADSVLVPHPEDDGKEFPGTRKAFSLAHFIPLLRERIYVVSPFTRSYLISWIAVLDSVPELELVSFLPEFLDGILKYLSDPIEDVRTGTETLLSDLLREIREISLVRHQDDHTQVREDSIRPESVTPSENVSDLILDGANGAFISDSDLRDREDSVPPSRDERTLDSQSRTGVWIPGQGVRLDYPALIEILLLQLDGEHDEIQQSTALRWLAEFLTFAHDVIVPFTPRLIGAILPNLAHHVPMIQAAAIRTNKLLTNVIENLPSPLETQPTTSPDKGQSPPPSSATTSRQSTGVPSVAPREPGLSSDPITESPTSGTFIRPRTNNSAVDLSTTPRALAELPGISNSRAPSRPQSPLPNVGSGAAPIISPSPLPPYTQDELDPFDYQFTVSELTIQFLSEFEETRVAALKWLIMLHQKVPKKILAMDDGTFPALLKTLSDSSEEVIKHDLQLLAQISSSSEENYFRAFMINLLELFSTDRRLLETRGSFIIRQLCLNLTTEKIYKAFAEILEKEEDLEFASVIVQKLNLILTTSPELSDFRKRLKSLETRQDGQALFTTLYRSWCHNAVSVFSLCLLAQAYEHASSLLQIFADLEITVAMLVQIDKLVQLIESPVFTYLRLQLLEPERYPYLFKCLYGLLMLLPQSTAFTSLRNRLNAVNSAGFLHISPKAPSAALANRSKMAAREEIKWSELLQHFRSTQSRHEKARRASLGPNVGFSSDFDLPPADEGRTGRSTSSSRPPVRRKVTGEALPANIITGSPAPGLVKPGILSPLNPRRTPGGSGGSGVSGLNPAALLTQQRAKKAPSTKKT
ncbi:vacuolar protein 14 C-terminal Fig4p binding-domain-containing protein [Flagelloscypha sp. PMI_526]|nr:vacuolar protein 14 C-terminal Fig4p binding-domain-containing protein [Flagelloscypha sp. PMI_526]